MDEAALRQLVREVVARQLHRGVTPPPGPPWASHPSHVQFELAPSPDGACIVEPAVRCNHCGFCQSMGH